MATEKNLNNLVINKVESEAVYNYMKANNLINVDELYFIQDADPVAITTDQIDTICGATIYSGSEVSV